MLGREGIDIAGEGVGVVVAVGVKRCVGFGDLVDAAVIEEMDEVAADQQCMRDRPGAEMADKIDIAR